MKISDGGFQRGMAKEAFKGIKISSLVEHMGGEGVAKRIDATAFVYAGFFLAT